MRSQGLGLKVELDQMQLHPLDFKFCSDDYPTLSGVLFMVSVAMWGM